MALALQSLECMSLLQTRPLEGVDVAIVSEVPDLVQLLQTTLRICGAGAVSAAASCRQLMQQRAGRGADAFSAWALIRRRRRSTAPTRPVADRAASGARRSLHSSAPAARRSPP